MTLKRRTLPSSLFRKPKSVDQTKTSTPKRKRISDSKRSHSRQDAAASFVAEELSSAVISKEFKQQTSDLSAAEPAQSGRSTEADVPSNIVAGVDIANIQVVHCKSTRSDLFLSANEDLGDQKDRSPDSSCSSVDVFDSVDIAPASSSRDTRQRLLALSKLPPAPNDELETCSDTELSTVDDSEADPEDVVNSDRPRSDWNQSLFLQSIDSNIQTLTASGFVAKLSDAAPVQHDVKPKRRRAPKM